MGAGDLLTQVNAAEVVFRINRPAFANLAAGADAPRPSEVPGYASLGPMKAPMYELLRAPRAPKGEALFMALRDAVSRANTLLPGDKRTCVPLFFCLHLCPSVR